MVMVDRTEYVVAQDRWDQWERHLFPDLATAESDLWDWTYEEYLIIGGRLYRAAISDDIDAMYEYQWAIVEYDPSIHGAVEEFTAGYNHTEEGNDNE